MGGGYGEINTWYYKLNKDDKFENIAYTAILSEFYEDMREQFGEDQYEIGTSSVSEEEFYDFKKKQLDGNTQKTKIAFHKNTAGNRKKYLS